MSFGHMLDLVAQCFVRCDVEAETKSDNEHASLLDCVKCGELDPESRVSSQEHVREASNTDRWYIPDVQSCIAQHLDTKDQKTLRQVTKSASKSVHQVWEKDKFIKIQSVRDDLNSVAILFPDLTKLDVSGVLLSQDNMQCMLQKFSNLQALKLNNCYIGDAGVRVLMEYAQNLQALYLEECNIGIEGIKVLAEHAQNLHTLCLNYNPMNIESVQLLAEMSSLRVLYLQSCHIDPESFQNLMENNNFQELHVDWNYMREISVESLENLKKHKNLRVLNLNGNALTYVDNRSCVAQALAENTSIEELYFQGCFLDDDTNMAHLIRNNKNIRVLDISRSWIGQKIGNAIKHSQSLQVLSLKYCLFGSDYQKILSCLKENISIQKLSTKFARVV